MLLAQLQALGVRPGGVLLVHTALSKVGSTAQSLIEALLKAVAPAGTLVMPSMADDDDVPFDRAHSSCRAVGLVADTFWRMPGVLRSDSPHAFAAHGPLAARITAPHPVDVPHETDHCCERFTLLDEWLGDRQKAGIVGNGQARLARSRDIVAAVLREDETVFLHAAGTCAECDSARAGIT